MLTLTITTEQKIAVALAPKTAAGNPATVDGPPTWSVVSGFATINVSPDGLSAELISSDSPGQSQFLINADADLGAGVENLQDVITLNVEGAKATSLGLTHGDPQPKA